MHRLYIVLNRFEMGGLEIRKRKPVEVELEILLEKVGTRVKYGLET